MHDSSCFFVFDAPRSPTGVSDCSPPRAAYNVCILAPRQSANPLPTISRIRTLNDASIRPDGDWVLYWMIANRRLNWNYSLDRAVAHCRELGKPLLVLEALRCGYRWASDRMHRFVLQGMADNRAAANDLPLRYYAYVEPNRGDGSGLLGALARRACVVVTDDFPCFFLPRMLDAAATSAPVKMEAVDSNGIVPLAAPDRVFARAFDFRRWFQKHGRTFLEESPKRSAFAGAPLPNRPSVPREILDQWPEATDKLLEATPDQLAALPIDHAVGPASATGGANAAKKAMKRFFEERLIRYATNRNNLDDEAASGFSPYLHFGHLSAHEVLDRIIRREDWRPGCLAESTSGAREGWWGMSPESESFLDELIIWRELGFNMTARRDDYASYDSLPDWAKTTLADHASDPREHVYDLETFESAETHDPLWNAAQRQLVRDGRVHNYMRMLWGKKILEWSPSPQDALEVMIELNNKYAVDGRDPNSYSGIFWVLGRYDRAWGPERPIFGKVRYMSSANTARKLNVKAYLTRYAPSAAGR